MAATANSARDDREALIALIVRCLREADRLGLHGAAIDLDSALHKVRRSPSRSRH